MTTKFYRIGKGVIRSHDWSVIGLLYLMAIGILMLINCWLHLYMQQGVTLRTVKAVCDYSHNIRDGGAEEACGIAQGEANAEYLCKPDGYSFTCWAEAK